jgi:hypothetical protein
MPTNNREKWEEKLNKFIIDWCGDFAHLLDTDENDGERLRETIRQEIRQAKIEMAEKINGIIGDSGTKCEFENERPKYRATSGVIWNNAQRSLKFAILKAISNLKKQ